MLLTTIVFVIAAVSVAIMIVCLINADEVEKHDEAVFYRWEDFGESEPPEWADPVKWWESER